jgi:hypothetical protein
VSRRRLALVLALLCGPLTACGGGSTASTGTAARPAKTVAARITGCPVTIPNGSTPPGEQPSSGHHGNGALWSALPPDGKIVATREFVLPDGSMQIKFPWWGSRRAGPHLRISGSSLDLPGGLTRSSITDGFTGAPHFWASRITFPTEGCWRVTGTAGRASLTFVVFVSKAASA